MTDYFCDANVWVALAVSGHTHNDSATKWLRSVPPSSSVLFCRATQQSFLRLLTNAAVQAPFGDPPLTNEAAWAAYESFLTDDRISIQEIEPAGVEPRWRGYAIRPTASPKLWMDAYLAAFARAAGYTLVTTDAAFRQFAGLDLLLLGGNPAERSS